MNMVSLMIKEELLFILGSNVLHVKYFNLERMSCSAQLSIDLSWTMLNKGNA